jgi:hypothetical protein
MSRATFAAGYTYSQRRVNGRIGMVKAVKWRYPVAKLTVEFNTKMDEILSDLAQDKGTTKVDVLRRAVALYKYIDSQLSPEGRRHLAITEDDRIVKEIVVP